MTSEPMDPQLLEVARRMFDLARFGHTEELVSYIDRRAPVNLTNEKGDTLLLLAAYYGHAETVAALLARGADHARVNDQGQTALAAAVFKQSAETVGHLLAAGADPDLGGQSARATAQFFGLTAMTELLDAPR
ncbi:ankyrin repeat domain-containing protein [Blastococcus sp. TF02-9]|uniref:ankyrin repeat domain-containing protein n=1 Tax=Blastococcus sp. TF02-09 TaxID=2250576 RepID=UPI001F46262C|nr:ankyrin repeat domain-containing protein [Blastococcus sp. TF02-9]